MNKYKIIAICGKSAVGKDTFLRYMIQQPNTHEVISCTTRPPREGEINGKNYYFISDYQFSVKEMRHEMLEVAGYRDWRYGTAIDSLDMNKTNVGVFNRKGIESLMNRDDIDLFVVMMIADSKTRLLRSLNREEFPDVNEIIRRYQADEKEWDNFHNFHFIISNEG